MAVNGISYPVIPYDLILDTDVGLYRLLKERYRNDEVFATSPLDLPLPYMLTFLVNRAEVNPLLTIARDNRDKELYDEYYRQFMEEEIDFILSNAVTTTVYNFIAENARDKFIKTVVWAPNDHIVDMLKRGDPNTFNNISFRVTPTYEECFKEIDQPLYVKNILDLAIKFDYYEAKVVYLANYGFNYTVNEVTGRKGLNMNVGAIVEKRMNVSVYDPYPKSEMKEIKG